MLAELTQEEYEAWLQAYIEEPWGERRDDQRNAATILWLRWHPKHEGDEPDLPNLIYPYWETKEQRIESEVETYKQLKARAIEQARKLKEKREKEKAERGG